jgi:hypothetical protein
MDTASRSVHEGVRLMNREVSEDTLAGMWKYAANKTPNKGFQGIRP